MTPLDLINTRSVLEAFGKDTVDTMRNILILNGKDVSGELIRSLSYQITYDETDTEASGTFEYSTNSGATWFAWDNTQDLVGNYIRYTATTLPNNITVRAIITSI